MKHLVWLNLVTIAALGLAGCGRTTAPLQATRAPDTGTEAAQIATVLADNPDAVNEDLYQNQDPQSFEPGGGFAAIHPITFWRRITDVQSSVDTQFGTPDSSGRPTTAIATIHRRLLGTFNILAGSVTPDDTSRTLVHKPLDDLWTRRVALVRVSDPSDPARSYWRIAGTSGVDVRTHLGVTRVLSLRITTATFDTTITEPLELHRLRHVIDFAPGTDVQLVATTGNATDVVLFYGRDMRSRFVNNGDGTFTFNYNTGRALGLHRFGVDALSHGTLFDDALPYDSNAWIFDYRVAPMDLPIEG